MAAPEPNAPRVGVTVHVEFPRPLPGSRCIAEWLRRIAAVIERGDSPHSATLSATASGTPAARTDGGPDAPATAPRP